MKLASSPRPQGRQRPSEPQRRAGAATLTGFAAQRPASPAQRRLVETLDASPRMRADRARLDGLHGSPALVAQRRQIVAGFGAAAAQHGAVVQRYIKVQDQKDSRAPFAWAMEYEKKRGVQTYSFAKVREALITIEESALENTDFFASEEALFDRVEELAEASKDRAAQPIWRETSPSKVMMELEYHFEACKQLPEMVLLRTYESNWDKNGGFGAEYGTRNEKAENWVIHVHRGQNGGLKSAKVKSWATRGEKHNGSTLFKFDNLARLGIAAVDTTRLD